MPLAFKIQHDSETTVYVWEITEELEALQAVVDLRAESELRFQSMKSISHKKGFLSVRMLLLEAGYTDFDLRYDASGKPHLKDGSFISITHSFEYSGIIISSKNVGIDIEMQREKIERIAAKFSNTTELEYALAVPQEQVRALTVIWGAKEAMYKMCNSRSLSFKNDMEVMPFNLSDKSGFSVVRSRCGFKSDFSFWFLEHQGFTIVYAK